MSFELENPEIVETIDQYKQGCIGYGEAKNRIVLHLSNNEPYVLEISDARFEEIKNQAKELLLGKEEKNAEVKL